jgi:hypothetical protein
MRYLKSSREERAARRAKMLARHEIVDPLMMRIAFAEKSKLVVGKKSARRSVAIDYYKLARKL